MPARRPSASANRSEASRAEEKVAADDASDAAELKAPRGIKGGGGGGNMGRLPVPGDWPPAKLPARLRDVYPRDPLIIGGIGGGGGGIMMGPDRNVAEVPPEIFERLLRRLDRAGSYA
jgi:hypothetical protein